MHCVYFDDREKNKNFNYPSNYIETSKYNLATFVPRCVFYQFSRLANIFFLVTAIVQCIPSVSPLHPVTAIGPLLLVLSISMVKEAIEDWVTPI